MILVRAVLGILLVMLLTSCGTAAPSRSVVEKAIALQLNQTQQELSQQLYTGGAQPPEYKIGRVRVAKQQALTIEAQKSFHLWGTYDLTLKFPDRQVVQRKNPFEVYLQSQEESQGEKDSWRLARPQVSEEGESWITQPIVQPIVQ